MTPEIVCNISMFSMNQIVYIYNNEKKPATFQINTTDLQDQLINMCYSKNIYKIHFFGNEEYISGLVEQIRTKEAANYQVNKIKIGVN